jgi:hypothetical protein
MISGLRASTQTRVMLLPASWNRLKRKRLTVIEDELHEVHCKDQSNDIDVSHLKGIVTRHIQVRAAPEAPEAPEDWQWLLSKMSIAKMLQSTAQPTERSIPIVTRKYEESFMRECKNDAEKPCVFQAQCECMKIDPMQAFVGVQFSLPDIGTQEHGMCVLCMRKSTHIMFYNLLHEGYNVKTVIQKYGNICNQAGEYHPSAMLICPPNGPVHCMPLPIVAHQRNRYSVITHHGIRYIQQRNVYMEDFPKPLLPEE